MTIEYRTPGDVGDGAKHLIDVFKEYGSGGVIAALAQVLLRLDRLIELAERDVPCCNDKAGQPGGPAVIHQPTLPVCGGNPIPGSVDGHYTEIPGDETCLQCGCLRSAHYCGTVCPAATPDQP